MYKALLYAFHYICSFSQLELNSPKCVLREGAMASEFLQVPEAVLMVISGWTDRIKLPLRTEKCLPSDPAVLSICMILKTQNSGF